MDGGWTFDEKEAMLVKLGEFYKAYYKAAYGVSEDEAENMALRSMVTLRYNDIFTMREILRLLYDGSRTRDASTKRNLLESVFNLLLVHNKDDPKSWTLARLHKLWKETINKK
jgi:hypothetical protein